jgi:dTDP-glucose pyrophosphorylase
MSHPQVRQLDQLELESIVAHGGDGRIGCRRVFTAADFDGPWNFVDYAVLPPGTSIGRHTHGDDEELYLVLEGEGTMHLDGADFAVRPGTLIRNRAGGTHGLRNDGDRPIRLLVVEVATSPASAPDPGPGRAPARSGLAEVVGMVMAGGSGTRMATSHPRVPKPLVEVGGVPLVEIVLRQLLQAGVTEIVLALRHESERLRRWIETHPLRLADRVRCLVEPEPLGTIGALFELRAERRTVLVMNGDLVSGVDLRGLHASHRASRADLTIATHGEFHRLRLGEVVADADHRVTDYREKPVKEYRISSGIYLVEPGVLALLQRREWLGFPDLVQRCIRAGLHVVEHFHQEPWLDVNDEADLREAQEMVRRDPVRFGLDAGRQGS